MSESVRCSEVREKTQELQDRFRELSRPCPEGVPIANVGSRIGLLGVDESRELRRVANEEHRSVCRALAVGLKELRITLDILLKTQSRIPFLVLILIEKPRGSLAVSAEPRAPPTVLNRIVIEVLVPSLKTSATEYLDA
jgi:hypothetical protein